jgi:hypothetical protein
MTEDHGFDELLRRVREGDERATAEMVQRYEPEEGFAQERFRTAPVPRQPLLSGERS